MYFQYDGVAGLVMGWIRLGHRTCQNCWTTM